jgi:hypothetical protein
MIFRSAAGRLCALTLGLTLSTSTFGQVSLDRFERQLEQIRRDTRMMVDDNVPAEQRALFDYGAYASFYFFAIDHPTTNQTHILRQTDLNGWLRMNIDGVHQIFARGRVGYQDFNSGDSFDGDGDDWVDPTLDRAVYRFDLRRAMEAYEGESPEYNFTIQAGRQLVHWANGLVLSADIDGGVLDFEYGPATLQVLAGRSRYDQVDIDSSRPNFDDEMLRNFYGAMLSIRLDNDKHVPYIYGLVQEDDNKNEALTVAGNTTRFDYNSFYIGAGSTGRITEFLRYGVEFAYQGGDTLSSAFDSTFATVTQTRDDIEAWALDARLDYFFHDEAGTQLTGELLLASGDDDRVLHTTNTFGGNSPGTTDGAFNAFGLVDTGLSFAPNASNLFMIRLGASTYPFRGTSLFRRLQVGTNVYIFNKFDSDAPIDETTSSDRYLGFETDFFANWQVTSDLALSVRYGVFFPGDAMPSDIDARHFLFTGVTVAF